MDNQGKKPQKEFYHPPHKIAKTLFILFSNINDFRSNIFPPASDCRNKQKSKISTKKLILSWKELQTEKNRLYFQINLPKYICFPFPFYSFFSKFLTQKPPIRLLHFQNIDNVHCFIILSSETQPSMKNRNDNKKYILAQQKKKQINNFFKRLDQIQRKTVPAKFMSPTKRMFGEDANGLAKIPRNHSEQRLYDIRMENERLVDKLSKTKITVVSHMVKKRQRHSGMKRKNMMRQNEIALENGRLSQALNKIKTDRGTKKCHFNWKSDI